MQELRRRPVDDGVDCPEEGAPALVVKHEDDRGLRQVVRVVPELAFFLTGVRNRPIERYFVRYKLDTKYICIGISLKLGIHN